MALQIPITIPIGAKSAIGSSRERPKVWMLSFQLDFFVLICFPLSIDM